MLSMKLKKRGASLESETIKPRRAWLAVLFSLFGGALGQVYCGRFRRGILLWLGILFLIQVPILSCAATLPLGRIGFALLLLIAVMAYPVFICVDALLLARRYRTSPLKRYQRWWFYLLFYLAFNFLNMVSAHGIRAFVAETFVIPSGSMAPTLQAGDQIFVDKLWFSHKRLQRNNLVVYRSAGPGFPPYIMRVIGLPGDKVEVKEEVVYINDEQWSDEHANLSAKLRIPEHANYSPITVPTDAFFVLGDNRRNANDSRLNGPIPLSDLIGKANMIYWSRERETFYGRYGLDYTPGPIVWSRIGTVLK